MFLKASSAEQYLLRLAARLAASYYTGSPITLSEVARQERLSVKYLEELVRLLKQSGLVEPVRGRKGGYLFVANPKTVTAKDIIWLIDDRRFLVACLDSQRSNNCQLVDNCQVKSVWKILQRKIEQELNKITLDKLVDKKYAKVRT